VRECITGLHDNSIGIHGMFALGSDDDDSDTIRDTVKFCHEMKLDSVQFAIPHPLPGSRLYSILNSEDRIFTKNWSLYDGTHVVFKPKKLHPLELQEKFFWAWKKAYTLWRKPHLYAACRYVISRWYKVNKPSLADLKKRFSSASDWYPFRKY